MSSAQNLQPITVHEHTRRAPGAHRRAPRHQGIDSDSAARPIHDDVGARLDRLTYERDAALLERAHLLDTVNDLKAAALRLSASGGGGAVFNHTPPPDVFTAELLKRDTLVEQWSRAYRDAVDAHNAERAKDSAELRTMRSEFLTAQGKIDTLSAQLLASHANEAASRCAATLAHEKCNALEAERATLRRHLTTEQTRRSTFEMLLSSQQLNRRPFANRPPRTRPARQGATSPSGSAAPSCEELLQLLQHPCLGSHLSQTSVRAITSMRGLPESDDSDAADGQQSAGLLPLSHAQPTSPPHTTTRSGDPGSPSTHFSSIGFGYRSM